MTNSKVDGRPRLSGDVYYPSENVIAQANIRDYEEQVRQAQDDLKGFWGERADELEWYRKWDKVLDDSDKPFYKWFVGARTNIVHNARRHVKTWRKNKLALIWEGENGDLRSFSYHALNREVCA